MLHQFSEFANKLFNTWNFAIITYLHIFELQSIVDGLAGLWYQDAERRWRNPC